MILLKLVIWTTVLSFTRACREIKLLTVEENEKGAILSIVGGEDSVQLQLNDPLSPECGSHFEHCQDLLVLVDRTKPSGNTITFLVFIPLNKALAIIEVEREEYAGDIRFRQVTVLHPTEVHCSPSVFVEIEGAVFAICTNQSTNDVYVLDIILNKTVLNQTRYTYSNVLHLTEGNLVNRTNFLQVNTLGYYFIVFGLDHAIYSIRPLFFLEGRLNDVPNEYCDNLRQLSPKDGHEFWAYCGNNVISYDLGAEDWIEAFTLEERGISFRCSQQGIGISVFQSVINVTRQNGKVHSIRKEGQNFRSGVCTGNEEKSAFVYIDGSTGIHSLNLNSFETRSISTGSCGDSSNCRAPLVIDDQYLLLRGFPQTILVLDSVNTTQRIMEVKDISAPMVTLLTFPCPLEPPSAPKDIGLQKSPSSSSFVGVAAALSVLAVAFTAIILVAIILVVIWKRKCIRFSTSHQPSQPEKNFNIERDDTVFPSPPKLHSVPPQDMVNSQNEERQVDARDLFSQEDQQPADTTEEEPLSAESSQSCFEHSLLIKSTAEERISGEMATSQV